jgi:hypothetical protein
MSSKQTHRGQHGNDPRLFHPRWHPILNRAVHDLAWLLTHEYAEKSALTLVGDRYRLNVRQRKALLRATCSDQARTLRQSKRLEADSLRGRDLIIDGYNLLITIESALAGGIVLECRDRCFRDIASVHGTYRRVEETVPALTMIGVHLQALDVQQVSWLLDKPVSNSGRLKGIMEEVATAYGFDWSVELVNNPDRSIVERPEFITVSSDGWVIDHCQHWFNLHRPLLAHIPDAQVIDLPGEV